MKSKSILSILSVVLVITSILVVLQVATPVTVFAPPPPTLWVSPATVSEPYNSCANPGYNTIGAAMTAAGSGATINVCAGTYPEQLLITKPLTLLGLGTPSNPTTIKPVSVTANAVDPDTSNSEAAIILVSGTTGVTIVNVVVDGSAASASIGLSGCSAPSYEGVLFLGASGTLKNSVVTNFYQNSPTLYGCQDNAGLAVLVQTPTAKASTVSISNNVVSNYQKNGITCNDAHTSCSINGNTVKPLPAATGPSGDAPNGIQMADGATGTISGNVVSGNVCTITTCLTENMITTAGPGTGILTYGTSGTVTISGNTLTGNDVGIYLYKDTGTVNSMFNVISGSTYIGMVVQDEAYTVKVQDTKISGPTGTLAILVLAQVMNTAATLKNVDTNLPFMTYGAPYSSTPFTAYIYIEQ